MEPATPNDQLRSDLTDRLVEQCRSLCETGEEGPLADALEARYHDRGEPVVRVGDSLVIGSDDHRPTVLLVGHLDVVPPTAADRQIRVEREDGQEIVVGRGTTDMKGGNVVAMRLFEDRDLRAGSPYGLRLVLYAGEEGPAEDNQLGEVLEAVPELAQAALAVVLEPTDLEVQVGCLGGLHALLTFHGTAAHSARPWFGRNALTRAGAFLAELDARSPRPVDVDGVTYHDVWTATQAWTDNARNVVPDRFVVNLNYRFAPDRSLATAEDELHRTVADRASVEIVDRAPPAPPRLEDPHVQAFLGAVGGPVTAKQAWTDVARLAEAGVPALNFGPGLTAQAHQAGEHVPVANLVAAHDRLAVFLRGG